MVLVAVILKHFILFPASEVRHVCSYEHELTGKNFRGLGDTLRGHRHLQRGIIRRLLRQCFRQ